jgi:hypothetical protein
MRKRGYMPATFLVSYDLRAPGRDYAKLYEAIRLLANGYSRPLESVWIIRSVHSAAEIRDALQKHIDGNDGLLVIEVVKHWATIRVAGKQTTWMKSHIA